MEYLPHNLNQLIEQHKGVVGGMPIPLFLRVAKEIALGMKYLHNCKPKVIHRDLKPVSCCTFV
jgi:serine/threonine protein kinase